MTDDLDDQPVTSETIEANRRWDMENGGRGFMDRRSRLRSQSLSNMVGVLLTDKRIRKYEAEGYYTEAYREARKEAMERRVKKRVHREGNFVVYPNGRKVYSPE